jgi:competence protein ComEC
MPMTLIYMTIGWLIGLFLAAQRPTIGGLWVFVTLGGAIGLAVMRREPKGRPLGIIVLMLGLALGRYSLFTQTTVLNESALALINDGGKYELIGIVSDAPDTRDSSIHLRVDIEAARRIPTGTETTTYRPVQGTALVDAERSGAYRYGDKVTIFGDPTTPPILDTFNYQEYLSGQGIHTLVSCYPAGCPQVHVLAHDQGSPFWATVFDIKDRARQVITTVLPEPESGLLTAMLLNDPEGMATDLRADMSVTGTSHLIVVAGAKVAIVGGFLLLLFGRIRRRWLSALLLIAGLVLYAIFTGGSAATLRATIMAILVILAERFGRRSDSLTALAFSVFLITLVSPDALFDLGLIVSSVATLGLILYLKPMTRFFEHLLSRVFAPETVKRVIEIVAEGILLTVAVEITTWPIFAYVFGQISRVSVLANVLVFPVQGVIVIGGLLCVLGSLIFAPLGQAIAWWVGLPLSYTVGVIQTTAAIPGAAEATSLSLPFVMAYYGVLLGMTTLLAQPQAQRSALLTRFTRTATLPLLAAGIGVAALLIFVLTSRPDGKLHVWFLSVGKGNAVLIQTPNGSHWLIDGGDNPTLLSTAIGGRLPFYTRDLDLLFITQHRPDTITALPPLFDRFTIKTALSNGQLVPNDPARELSAKLNEANSPVVPVLAGYTATSSDGVTLDILGPASIAAPVAKKKPDGTLAEIPTPDDAPLVLRLRYCDASFLITSVMSEEDVTKLLASGLDLHATVLELPSNGAKKPNTPAFFAATTPQVTVAMAEQGNRNAQPDDTVISALNGLPLYRTDLQGTIEFDTDGVKLWISTEKQ